MRGRSLLLMTTAAMAVAAPVVPAAHAKLPKFADETIVVGESIAGVALGDKPAKAQAAWGGKGGNCTSTSCFYRPGRGLSSEGGEGWFSFSGTVSTVELKAPVAPQGGHVFVKPFTVPKTSKGIGIGSTAAAVRRAYPAAEAVKGSSMIQIRDGRVLTLFSYDSDSKRVFAINIQKLPG